MKPSGSQLELKNHQAFFFLFFVCLFACFVLIYRAGAQDPSPKLLIWLVLGGYLILKQLVVVVFNNP